MPSDPQAVIFDFDGLMIDSERVEADCIIEALAGWGVAVCYKEFGHLFGSVDADTDWEELLRRWCGRTATELDAVIGAKTGPLKDDLPLMPGVRELIDAALERGLRLGLATGNTLPKLQKRLGRHGVFDHFEAIVTRSEVARASRRPTSTSRRPADSGLHPTLASFSRTPSPAAKRPLLQACESSRVQRWSRPTAPTQSGPKSSRRSATSRSD